jgi:hypothetical protein
VPVKPFRELTVTVTIADWPTLTEEGEEAVIAKSWTTNVSVTEWDSVALVPVTPTWTEPAMANVHDSVELPDRVTLVGDRVHEVLLVARATTPANPFRPVTVMVDVPGEPAFTVTDVGLDAIVKSSTTNVTMTAWDRGPLVPVTPTWNDWAVVKVHDSVLVPDPVILVGLNMHAVLFVPRLMTPDNPNGAVTVMVEVAAGPAFTVIELGLAAIVKSWTV